MNNDQIPHKTNVEDTLPRKRTRSPASPVLSLEDAIAKTKPIWDHEKRNATTIDALAQYWEFSPKSSAPSQFAATLKQFGLLEEVEIAGQKSRKLKLSDAALNIILDDENSPERKQILKRCALQPPMHSKLWNNYNGDLPSDISLRRSLIMDERFNDAAVDGFIKKFRETIAFAKLVPSDKVATVEILDNDTADSVNTTINPIIQTDMAAEHLTPTPAEGITRFPRKVEPAPTGVSQWIFPVEGKYVRIEVPENLSKAVWEKVNAYIQILKPSD